MKPKIQHIAHRNAKKVTLMIVPNNTGKIKKLTILPWIPKAIATSLVLLIAVLSVSTYYFSDSLTSTEKTLADERVQVVGLKEERQQHISEIDELHRQFRQVDERLARMNELESKVLTLVGLETPAQENEYPADESQVKSEVSPMVNLHLEKDYFASQFLLVSRSTTTRTMGPVMNDYDVDVKHLSQLIETQTSNMVQLVENVEDQLEYLDAEPNLWPATGRISSPYGNRVSPTNRYRTEFHQGIDIAGASGSSIIASGSGIVTYSGYNGGYGRMVIISHGYGYTSVYAHNSQNLVEVGDRVEKGDLIAKMGRTGRATGTHLHFEVRIHGEPIDPLTMLE